MNEKKCRLIIFEGPNRAGKTTLMNGLMEDPIFKPLYASKGVPNNNSREALEQFWHIIHGARLYGRADTTPDPYIIFADRVPYPSDLVYRPIIDGQISADLTKHHSLVIEALQEFHATFVYVRANPEDIKRRYAQLGDHYHAGKPERIDAISAAYGSVFNDIKSEAKIPVIDVDTTVLSRTAAVEWCKTALRTIYGEQGYNLPFNEETGAEEVEE